MVPYMVTDTDLLRIDYGRAMENSTDDKDATRTHFVACGSPVDTHL